jgi:hypothetical protein
MRLKMADLGLIEGLEELVHDILFDTHSSVHNSRDQIAPFNFAIFSF